MVPRMTETLDFAKHAASVYLLPLGLRVVLALALFWIGRLLARGLMRGLDRGLAKSAMDISLRKFLKDVIYAVMLVAIVIASLDLVGVKTTAVVAVLGAAGLAIGLALQSSLSNFAAGVMLIVLRPYKVTDVVMLGGKYLGRVDAIKVFHTVLITDDNREVTIPNNQIITGAIENYTVLGRRRVDLVVTVSSAPAVVATPPAPVRPLDLASLKALLQEVVLADDRVLAAPPPAIAIAEATAASVKLVVRPWTAHETHSAVAASTIERARDALAAQGHETFTIALA